MTKIETKRLEISEFTVDDATFIFKLLNTPGWLQFIGTRNINNPDDAKLYINNKIIASYNTNGFGFYKITLKDTGNIAGMCGFAKRDYLNDPDLGFAFLPEHEGKGYAYEAAKSCMDYSKNVLMLNRICAITVKENIRSVNLLEKLNMKYEKMVLPADDKEELMLYITS